MSDTQFNIKRNILILLIVTAILEAVICGIQQAALFEPYKIAYAVITVVFLIIEVLFCKYLERFSDGSKGIKLFFTYKIIKVFIVVMPIVIYTFFIKNIDPWIPGRAIVYYFVFLLFETAMYVKSQKKYKVAVNDK